MWHLMNRPTTFCKYGLAGPASKLFSFPLHLSRSQEDAIEVAQGWIGIKKSDALVIVELIRVRAVKHIAETLLLNVLV